MPFNRDKFPSYRDHLDFLVDSCNLLTHILNIHVECLSYDYPIVSGIAQKDMIKVGR